MKLSQIIADLAPSKYLYFEMRLPMETKSNKQRIWKMVVVGFALALLLANAQTAKAQWTTGTNINNTNSGNVGIGTSSTPSQKLDVVGNILLDSSSNWYGINKVSGEARAVMFNGGVLGASENDYLYFGSLNNGFKFVDSSNSPLVTILNSGNVGIGTSAPSQKLEVVGNGVRIGNPFE